MMTFIVNLDYEWVLFGKTVPEGRLHRIQKEFEFIFLFVEESKSQLYSNFIYPDDYLNSVRNYVTHLNDITNLKKNLTNWWGKLEKLKEEKKINSKISALEISRKINLLPEGVMVVNSVEEFLQHLDSFSIVEEFILKDPNSMGGQGNFIFRKRELGRSILKIKSMINSGPVIFSPFFNRTYDLGTLINLESNSLSTHLNFNTKFGIFRGGRVAPKELLPDNFVVKTISIINEYKSIGATHQLQIDSFLYQDTNGEHKFYHLLEANYRKTMGYFIRSICHHFKNKIENPSLLIIYRSDLTVDLFHSEQQKILLDNGMVIVSPDFLIDSLTREKQYLENIFLVIPSEVLRKNNSLLFFKILKPNSSTSILLNDIQGLNLN